MPTLFIESDLSSLMSYDSSSETVTIRKTFEINPIYTSTGGEIRFYAPIKMYKGTISNIPSSTLLIPLPTGNTYAGSILKITAGGGLSSANIIVAGSSKSCTLEIATSENIVAKSYTVYLKVYVYD